MSYLLYAGLVCLLIYVLGQWRDIAKSFSSRQARYGTLTGVSVLVVLGILVAINYIGARQNKRWDLTANQQFSLSDQTRNVLSKLDAPLQITVFAEETDFGRYRERLNEYEYASKKVSTEYVDPDKKPALASAEPDPAVRDDPVRLQGPHRAGDVGGRAGHHERHHQGRAGADEEGLLHQGHGEKDTASAERDGYKAIADSLGRENYSVENVVLAQTGAVPDDAAVVIVAGPKIDFLPGEIDALKKYLDKSGKLLLEIDPPEKPDSAPLTNLIALAHDWGIDVGNDIVVDAAAWDS